MASQDLISQFTQASQSIPASQPDRSRTPRRPHQDWHQLAPTFRGPMRYAMAASRPMWHNSGLPPPPPQPPALFSPSRPSWTTSSPTTSFPPTPPILPTGPPDLNPFTPQRYYTTTPKSPPSTTTPPGISPIRHGYTCRPCEIPPVDAWKPDVDFHDSNKVNGLDLTARIRQSKFASFKDMEGMDPLQVPLWKFLYQGLHNTWLRRIAYGKGKPSCSHSTTSALQSSSPNWWPSSAHGMWIWISWQHTNLEPQATMSPKRKQLNTWQRKLPS